jgi:hypothetical protein
MSISKQDLNAHGQKLRELFATEDYIVRGVPIHQIAKAMDVSEKWVTTIVGRMAAKLVGATISKQTSGVQEYPSYLDRMPATLASQSPRQHAWLKENFYKTRDIMVLQMTNRLFGYTKSAGR